MTVLLVACGYRGYEPEYRDMQAEIAAQPAYTEIAGTSGDLEPRLLELLAREPEPDLSGPLSLDALAEVAYRSNPELRAAVARVSAALERVPQEAALDDPMLKAKTFWGFGESPMTGFIGAALGLLRNITSRPTRVARAHAALQAARAELERLAEIAADLRLAIARSLADIYAAREAFRINAENQGLTRDILAITDARYQAGAVTQQDVLRARVRVNELVVREHRLRREIRAAESELNEALGRPADAPLGSIDFADNEAPPPLLADALAQAHERRAERRAAIHALWEEWEGLRAAEGQWTPEIKPELTVEGRRGGEYEAEAMAEIGLPFLNPRPRTAAQAEARARILAAFHELRAVEVRISREVRQAHARLEESVATLALLRDLLVPDAQQTVEAARAAYEGGQLEFTSLIDAQVIAQELLEERFRTRGEAMAAREELRRYAGE